MKVRKLTEEKILKEASLDDTIAAAENQLENPEVADGTPNQIEQALNKALRVALRNKKTGGNNYTNVLLIGGAGTGKTSIVRAWAQANNVNLVLQNTSTMDETDLTGVIARSKDGDSTVKLRSDVLKGLNEPRSVLFLDEYNRGRSSVRGTLLTLINDHLIDTGTDQESNVKGLTGKHELKNMLFTVAAINPASGEYTTDELDPAEMSRFRRVEVRADKGDLLKYLTKEISRQANALDPAEDGDSIEELSGQLGIAKKLLSDPKFQFDNEEDERAGYQKYGRDYTVLSPRSFTNLLQATDGTKEDFLYLYNDYCNPMKKSTMEQILSDYDDIDDKANSVFKKRVKSDEEKLDDFLNL